MPTLLPEHDPAPMNRVFLIVFVVLVAAWIVGRLLAGFAFAALEVFFLVVCVLVIARHFIPRGGGTRADDAALREEVRSWKDVRGGRDE
jgi:hypothetical protein